MCITDSTEASPPTEAIAIDGSIGAKCPKIIAVVGARPNFMKIAPVLRALENVEQTVEVVLVHTGQHYDFAMNDRFFQQLAIRQPDICLDVGSGTHAGQTANIMLRFESVMEDTHPDCVLVVGDVNSTVACALVAAKMHVKIVHIEAGLRSGDRSMPEEINRVLTDQLSDRLYVTERTAIENLLREGVGEERIVFAGNVMIDTLQACRSRAVPAFESMQTCADPDIFRGGYAVLTLHRPSNVDDPVTLAKVVRILAQVALRLPIVFPVHPRTRSAFDRAGLSGFLANPRVLALDPLGYLEMLGLMMEAKLVLTDSGGIQEETTAIGVPCITLRQSTERPITLEQGTNSLAGTDAAVIHATVESVLTTGGKRGRLPEKWDGHAAERIVADLCPWLYGGSHQ